jgi:flagellar basal-body rod modification protein FlgD
MAGISGVDSATTIDNKYYDNTEIIDGARYTTEEDPNKMTSEDFLELLLEEMKMQDPTKPMDSQKMMDTQLQMSTIEANVKMAESMEALRTTFTQTALANSADMIGHVVEDGSIGDDGMANSYQISSVESEDGDIFLVGYRLEGLNEEGAAIYSEEKSYINMSNVTRIF